jgi:hypothetical protein
MIGGGMVILRRLIRELRVTPRERTYVRRFQNAQDYHLGQNYTRDMHARRPFKTSHQRIMVARRDTRSRSCMRALQRIQSGCPVHPEPGHGSRTSAAHSMRIIEGQSRPNSPQWGNKRQLAARQPKRRSRQHPLPGIRCAPEADGGGPPGPSTAARASPVDSITARISAASRTPAGNSWWFSAFERDLQVDLAHSAPSRSTSSPIVMVTSTPGRQDHLDLIGTAHTPPAGSCTAARQWGEQKRSIVQRRSALSTALRSAIVRAMRAGGATAGAEGALTAIRPSFPARNWVLKSSAFQCTVPPPTTGRWTHFRTTAH